MYEELEKMPTSEDYFDSGGRPCLSPSCASVLSEPVLFLEANAGNLIAKWTDLYLSHFGRRSFFSPERVRRVFEEMTAVFLSCLKKGEFEPYFLMLKEKGKFFSGLGVPFEEVILCLQLFEEAYLSLILDNKRIVKHRVEDILLAFEEFHHLSTALFAVSYFRTAKKDWQNACRGYQEENDRLREELKSLHDEFLNSTKNELASMELLIQGINRKLRKSVVQSRRVQLFSELLEKESNQKNFLKIADKFFRQILPAGSQAIFGLFDENQRKVTLYSSSGGPAADAIPVLDEVFFSQLPLTYQEALFNESKGVLAFQDAKKLPPFLAGVPRLGECRDFLFLPARKYHDPLGFVFLASPEKDLFAKTSVKYFQRLARAFSQGLFSLIYFNRQKKHSKFISILDELDEKVLQRNPLETTLDFCLGSLIDLVDVERASLMLLDKEKKSLSIYAAKGYKVYPFSGLVLKWGEGVAGWSVKESKIISIPRMKAERSLKKPNGGFFPSIKAFEDRQLPVQSLLCVPLIHSNEPIGVINLSTLSYHKNFEPSEIDMVNQFAQRISSAITSLATIKDFETLMKPYLEGTA